MFWFNKEARRAAKLSKLKIRLAGLNVRCEYQRKIYDKSESVPQYFIDNLLDVLEEIARLKAEISGLENVSKTN